MKAMLIYVTTPNKILEIDVERKWTIGDIADYVRSRLSLGNAKIQISFKQTVYSSSTKLKDIGALHGSRFNAQISYHDHQRQIILDEMATKIVQIDLKNDKQQVDNTIKSHVSAPVTIQLHSPQLLLCQY